MMKRVHSLITSLLLLTISTSMLFAAETLGHQQVLYKGSRVITSNQNESPAWVRLASPNLTTASSAVVSEAPQKWRLRVFYSVLEQTGSFSIQARLNMNSDNRPVFSLGWDTGANRLGSRQAFSNWLELADNVDIHQLDVDIFVARSSNNPQANIEIHSVELEIWQDSSYIETKKASGIMPNLNPSSITRNSQERAKEVGLNFLRAAMSANRAEMNQYLSSNPVNMTQMVALSRSNVNFINLPQGKSFQDYLDNYEVSIVSYREIAGLFDDWEKYVVNNWQISLDKSYLLIGNSVKIGGEDFLAGKPLILVLEEETGRMVVKGILN